MLSCHHGSQILADYPQYADETLSFPWQCVSCWQISMVRTHKRLILMRPVSMSPLSFPVCVSYLNVVWQLLTLSFNWQLLTLWTDDFWHCHPPGLSTCSATLPSSKIRQYLPMTTARVSMLTVHVHTTKSTLIISPITEHLHVLQSLSYCDFFVTSPITTGRRPNTCTRPSEAAYCEGTSDHRTFLIHGDCSRHLTIRVLPNRL